MADEEHLAILRDGVGAWNRWREIERAIPNLDGADLAGMDLTGIELTQARLNYANLEGANLSSAMLIYADMIDINLQGANLTGAVLQSSRLLYANLRGAVLRNADLRAVNLSLADLTGADISGSQVFGISPWAATLDNVKQAGLVITQADEPSITVDNLAVAQFIYLLLNNATIRDTLDTITSKVVLILGRFSADRMVILNLLRDELRLHDYSPIVFDFNQPAGRDLTETVSTLAHLARFVIAELTDPRSVPQELSQVIPHLPSVPVLPLLQSTGQEYALFEHFRRYPWVLPIYVYGSPEELRGDLRAIIAPAEDHSRTLRGQDR
jgi:hypothetical protein